MNVHLLRIGLMLLLLATGQAQALCVGPPVKHVFVGDTASDSACTFNDLQSAIDDASTNPSCTSVIHVTREHTYTDQHLTISNRNVRLVAWGDGVTCTDVVNQCAFFTCPLPPAATNPLVVVSGHDGDSVIHIDGASNVSLLNLTITGGSVDQNGGGIYYDGTGSLTLTSTTVNLNQAGTGGGIYMNGYGGAANLYLNAYSQIIFNTVTGSGGGIFLEGQARLFALYSHTLIGFNHAPQGYGGGIGVIGPARVDIGSTGFNGLPVIYNNSALYGGGISATGNSDQQDSVVRVFTNDAQAPVQISDNIASATGGAVYLKSSDNFDGVATSVLCAFSFRMEDNIAQEGTAIYADSGYFVGTSIGSHVELNVDTTAQYCSTPEPLSAFGAVPCATDVACNRISGNVAEDSDGVATTGSTILVQTGGQLAADRIEARANAGAHFLRQVSDDGQNLGDVRLTDCLLAGNTLTQELVAKTDGDTDLLLIDSCTFAANQIGTPFAFAGRGTFYLVNSIIDQPGRATIDVPGGGTVANILSNDVTTLPTTPDIILGEPTFIDATHGDFHLRPTSPGIDFSPEETLDRKHVLDLDGNTRVVDLPYAPNHIGAMDLGAYEIQLDTAFPCARDDTLFCNGFELAN